LFHVYLFYIIYIMSAIKFFLLSLWSSNGFTLGILTNGFFDIFVGLCWRMTVMPLPTDHISPGNLLNHNNTTHFIILWFYAYTRQVYELNQVAAIYICCDLNTLYFLNYVIWKQKFKQIYLKYIIFFFLLVLE